MLEKIKIYLGISDTSKDSLLQLMIDDVRLFAMTYCNIDVYSVILDSIVINMVLERYNKLGIEGISSRSYSGISESYSNDFSPTIYKQLNLHRRIRMIQVVYYV